MGIEWFFGVLPGIFLPAGFVILPDL